MTIKKFLLLITGIATLFLLALSGTASAASHMRTPINYLKSSETIPYPDINKLKDPWIKVSIAKNRVYIMDGHRCVYTMYASAGKYESKHGKRVSATPTGTFAIQDDRGASFYNAAVKCGANNYVSWHDNGAYLFHSVPTDKDGHYIKSEAAKLGKQTASHGCIRLSVPDSKWMMNVPTGTKVVVQEN
ncbi:MAG TPA: L,D-transpeptidase [Limosilactobacillus oris]|uniref:L,D-transpeptidase n=1 Tax=Limosilactobacillus oris TaxID=1632 RepID=UPI001D253930|nr:L,D-transpeptidase [Limosilactobacillus oris]HJF47221.1 L,D-transpeptidase [Limosilactobacillus oris]